MISYSTHKELYDYNDQKYLDSLKFAKNLSPYRTKEPMNFHLYWRVPRNFERKQILPIKSIIANHEELNSGNYKITLWSNIDLSCNEYIKPFNKYITHKIWDPIQELEYTPLSEHKNYFKSIIMDDKRCWLGGDFFRLLCLYKYGGFYIDMDMCILRDLSPLNEYEFLYQWGNSGTTKRDPNIFFNGAIMKLNKKSSTALKFITLLKEITPIPETTSWGSSLYNHVKDEKLKIFPCAWFNTEWGLPEGIMPMSNSGDVDLYDGAFSWHWHNNWDTNIEDKSKFKILEEITENKIKNIL